MAIRRAPRPKGSTQFKFTELPKSPRLTRCIILKRCIIPKVGQVTGCRHISSVLQQQTPTENQSVTLALADSLIL